MRSPLHDVCLFASHSPAFSSVDSLLGGASVAGPAVAADSAHSSPAPVPSAHSALTERPTVQCPAASASAPATMRNIDIALGALIKKLKMSS